MSIVIYRSRPNGVKSKGFESDEFTLTHTFGGSELATSKEQYSLIH